MRQLNQTGWMHNRVRMIVASFLIKDLRIDWQSGERYFMHHLLDADVAANNGNWQWCASTGSDAMPRISNFQPYPAKQEIRSRGSLYRDVHTRTGESAEQVDSCSRMSWPFMSRCVPDA